ncbi:MAG TPA: serine/threonine-protein kinase, partial [Candidatus Hydrogenedentes bacterium]|nr:serine/threonine-protein kinase [Candidatus Hydrogenedentota bacterium]
MQWRFSDLCRECRAAIIDPNAALREAGLVMQDRDRNLLFAVLAVQLKGVTPQRVIEAASAWMVDPSRPLSARLTEMGALRDEDVGLLDRLVDEAVRACQGNVVEALESIQGGDILRASLAGAPGAAPKDMTRPMAGTARFELEGPQLAAVEEIPGRYSQISEQGRGGMGRVLLLHDECLGRDIALKELLIPHDVDYTGPPPSPMRETTAMLARFLREARVTGQLEHPSIVPVYELGRRRNGSLYYTMKLVRGKTLAHAIRDAGSLEARLRLLPHLMDLCQALAYSHTRSVVHRDIKPANIMIGEFGETVLLDWGLAKVVGQADVHADEMKESLRILRLGTPEETPQTIHGEAVGTPHYMSPEQADGRIEDLDY